jgi:hypothetical protein
VGIKSEDDAGGAGAGTRHDGRMGQGDDGHGCLGILRMKYKLAELPVAQETLSGRRAADLTEAEKLDLAKLYFLTGNLSEIARTKGIFYTDLLEIAREGLFAEEMNNLEREANAQMKVRFRSLMASTLTAIEERLQNGDYKMVAKTGQIKRIPVSARDLTTIASTVFDKKKIIEDTEKGFGSTEAKKLLSIADALRKIGHDGTKQIDGETLENE